MNYNMNKLNKAFLLILLGFIIVNIGIFLIAYSGSTPGSELTEPIKEFSSGVKVSLGND